MMTMYAWQQDIQLYAEMAVKFQEDNERAAAFKKETRRKPRDGAVFLGEDAVTYFSKQFRFDREEATAFGQSLLQDCVFTDCRGTYTPFRNERIVYRFTWNSFIETKENILLQRCPALHNQSEDEKHSNASRCIGTDDAFSDASAFETRTENNEPVANLQAPVTDPNLVDAAPKSLEDSTRSEGVRSCCEYDEGSEASGILRTRDTLATLANLREKLFVAIMRDSGSEKEDSQSKQNEKISNSVVDGGKDKDKRGVSSDSATSVQVGNGCGTPTTPPLIARNRIEALNILDSDHFRKYSKCSGMEKDKIRDKADGGRGTARLDNERKLFGRESTYNSTVVSDTLGGNGDLIAGNNPSYSQLETLATSGTSRNYTPKSPRSVTSLTGWISKYQKSPPTEPADDEGSRTPKKTLSGMKKKLSLTSLLRLPRTFSSKDSSGQQIDQKQIPTGEDNSSSVPALPESAPTRTAQAADACDGNQHSIPKSPSPRISPFSIGKAERNQGRTGPRFGKFTSKLNAGPNARNGPPATSESGSKARGTPPIPGS